MGPSRAVTVPAIAFLTDFGTSDPYVGMMKGVVLTLAPGANLVDVTHGIAPQDVRAGAFWLGACLPYFPERTLFVAVVDPGVGTTRGALLVETPKAIFVGPDNGLFGEILAKERAPIARRLERANIDALARARGFSQARVGATFDGRDLFAKAAALFAAGVEADALGSEIPPHELVRLSKDDDKDSILVVAVDHFGNLLSDRKWSSEEDPRVVFGETVLRWVETYADAEEGELVALRSSAGTLEVAVRGGNAAAVTGFRPGSRLSLALETHDSFDRQNPG